MYDVSACAFVVLSRYKQAGLRLLGLLVVYSPCLYYPVGVPQESFGGPGLLLLPNFGCLDVDHHHFDGL